MDNSNPWIATIVTLCVCSNTTYKLTHPLNSMDNSNPWMATIVTLCVGSNTTYKLTLPLNSVDNSPYGHNCDLQFHPYTVVFTVRV